jgi:hypothetical protein
MHAKFRKTGKAGRVRHAEDRALATSLSFEGQMKWVEAWP